MCTWVLLSKCGETESDDREVGNGMGWLRMRSNVCVAPAVCGSALFADGNSAWGAANA